MTANDTVSWEDHQVPAYANFLFASIYILCTITGLPGNIIALVYFTTSGVKSSRGNINKSFFNSLYIMTSLVDTLVCATLLPQIVSFMKHRDEAWYSNPAFCYIWGILWEILPYMSVFLVGIMSISRTTLLIKPLYKLNIRTLWVSIVAYFLFLALRTAIPVLMKDATYMYWITEVYCYEMPSADWAYKFNSVTRTTTLAVPVIPICISCVTSYIIILRNEHRQAALKQPTRKDPRVGGSKNNKKLAKSKKGKPMHATFTILIFTCTYIIFSIPVFANYLLMAIASYMVACDNDCYLRAYEASPFLTWYSWNLTYIMCVALNSAVNPSIYYWRMSNVHSYVNDKVYQTSSGISSRLSTRKLICREPGDNKIVEKPTLIPQVKEENVGNGTEKTIAV